MTSEDLTLVPRDLLRALSQRQLTLTETRLILAILSLSHLSTPGQAHTKINRLAKTLGLRIDKTADLVRHCADKSLINIYPRSHKAGATIQHTYAVNEPGYWQLPG